MAVSFGKAPGLATAQAGNTHPKKKPLKSGFFRGRPKKISRRTCQRHPPQP